MPYPRGGYDIVNNLDGVIDEFDRIVGLDRLKAIHLNDSKILWALIKIGTKNWGRSHRYRRHCSYCDTS